MFDSETNKQHQRALCKEIRRLPNETTKQLEVRFETLVKKTYSFDTPDYQKYENDRSLDDEFNM